MKRIFFSLLIVCSFAFNVFAQNDKTLVTIGNTKVSKSEFERIYKKNNSNLYDNSEKKSPEEYIDLFINFKLKVIEAENLQMDTSAAFINELAGYRKELAAPYLTDVKYNEKMVKELYERMNKEVNASHILIAVKKNATPAEDRAALEKIQKIRKEILAGKDFGEAAVKYSNDPSAKTNKGNLGYFTAFQMVAPFENAAFTTPVGEISQPVRTSFGYHLIKVNDIRKNQGEILVAHIMKMFPRNMTPEIKAKKKAEIDEIYKELLNGADFAELAKEKSEDERTARMGGNLPWIRSGRMIKEFAEPAFALKNKGDISKPIETKYGYHIIKKIDERGVDSFEDSKEKIEMNIKRDPARSISSKKVFTDKLKKEYNYSENSAGVNILKEKQIGDRFENVDFEIFSIDGKKYKFDKFRVFIANNNIKKGTYYENFDNWVSDEITKLEDSKLEEKYPEFKYMMQEYHDGILLFNISEEKIWNKAVKDTVGLEAFYAQNKKRYKWEEHFKGEILTCNDTTTREEADKFYASGMTTDELNEAINKKRKVFTVTTGIWEKGSSPVIDFYVWGKEKPADLNEQLTFIHGEKLAPAFKTLEEARGLYISDYQDYLEKEWIKELRNKYKVEIDKKLLKTIKGV
jgi:peptidyl-prolyl cis-trans isomerase SurA